MTHQNEDEIRAQIRAAVEQARLAVAKREMYGGKSVLERARETAPEKRTRRQSFELYQSELPTRRRDSSDGRRRSISAERLSNRHRRYRIYQVDNTKSLEKGKLIAGTAKTTKGDPSGRVVTGSPAQAAKKAARIVSRASGGSDENNPNVFDLVEITQGMKLRTAREPYGKNRVYRYIGWVKEMNKPHALMVDGKPVEDKDGNQVYLKNISKAYKVKRDNWHLSVPEMMKLVNDKVRKSQGYYGNNANFQGVVRKDVKVQRNDRGFIGQKAVKPHQHKFYSKTGPKVKTVNYSRAYGKEVSKAARDHSREPYGRRNVPTGDSEL